MARYPVLIIVFAFAASLGGVFIGRSLFMPEPPVESQLHTLIHHELKLDAVQTARIEDLERRFAVIQAEKGYGPKVAEAVDLSHHAMGMLQKQTLQHLFAMRAVLTPDQARRFDQAMVDSLTVPER
jgi:hypothetical protein